MAAKQTFEKSEALKFAELSELAYSSYAQVREKLPQFDLTALSRFSSVQTDTEGYIATDPAQTHFIVAFTGMDVDSLQEWLKDTQNVPEEILPGNKSAKGQKGFINCLDSVYNQIERKLKAHIGKKEIFITGHSLGGALASLFAYRLAVTYPDSKTLLRLHVYGCPPVGDKTFQDTFQDLTSFAYTHGDDSVSRGAIKVRFNPRCAPVKEIILPQGGHSIDAYVKTLKALQDQSN